MSSELKYEFVAEDKNLLSTIDKINNAILQVDKNLTGSNAVFSAFSKSADDSFNKSSKAATSHTKDINSLVNQIKFLEKEYIRIDAMPVSSTRTKELNDLTIAYDRANESLVKFGSGLKTYTDSQQKTSSTGMFKEYISDIGKASTEMQKLNAYYKELEKNTAKASAAENKIAKKETLSKINSLNIALQKAKTIEGQLAAMSNVDLINFNPKNINQANAAVQELTKRRNALNKTDKNYIATLSKLNSKQATLISQNKKATSSGINLQNSIKKTTKAYAQQSTIISQVKGQLAGAFGIYGAERFLSKMVKIRGEFELQSVALSAMLQDKKLANELFQEVQEMALESPFKILELNGYLKQLKAFRVENDELISTLKMLGDTSAGVGVDMSRLILAYGQVKSAEFLRGQEVRQFTEAGIPILGALADQFTELEGKAVSVNEVFEKISNRLVPFEMVKKVFQDMTTEGGIFYDQQRLQAHTLSGEVSILVDKFELMLNALGQANDSNLKGAIKGAQTLVDNYESVLAVIKVLIATYGIYKTALLTNLAIEVLRVNGFNRMLILLRRTAIAQALLNKALLANPYVAVAAGIAAVSYGLYQYYKVQEKVNQQEILTNKIKTETTKRVNQEVSSAKLLVEQLKLTEVNSKQRLNLIGEINEKYPELLKNIDAETASMSTLSQAYSSFVDEISKGIRMDVILEDLKATIAKMDDAVAASEKAREHLAKTNEAPVSAVSGDVQVVAERDLKNKEKESKLLKEQVAILEEKRQYQADINKYDEKYAKIAKNIRENYEARLDVEKELADIKEGENNNIPGITYSEQYYGNLNKQYEVTKELVKLEQERKKLAEQMAEYFRVDDTTFDKWKKGVNDIIELSEITASDKFSISIRNKDEDYNGYIEKLRSGYGELVKEIGNVNEANAKRRGFDSILAYKEELDNLLDTYKDIEKYLGLTLAKKTGGGSSNNGSFALKAQKQQLGYLEEVRQFYLQIKSITKDTSLGTEPLLKLDVDSIFGGKAGYEDAIKSFTDGAYEDALNKLIETAEKSKKGLTKAGKASVDAFIAGIRDKLTDIEEIKLIDEKKLDVEAEELRQKILSDTSPFGEDIVWDISLATTQAENDINEIAETYDTAMRNANDAEIKRLDAKKAKEIKSINEVKDAKIAGLVDDYVKKELGNLSQFYTNVGDASFTQLIKVNKEIKKIAKLNIDPIDLVTDETLESLNTTEEELAHIVEASERFNIPIEEAAELMGKSNEEAEKLGKAMLTATEDSNTFESKLESIVVLWKQMFSEEVVNDTFSAINTALEQMSNLFNSFDNEKMSKFAESFDRISENLAAFKSGYDTGGGGVSGAISGIAFGITDIASSLIAKNEASDATVAEYNAYMDGYADRLALIRNEQELIRQESEGNIFGIENPFKDATDGAANYATAMENINATVKALGEDGEILSNLTNDVTFWSAAGAVNAPFGLGEAKPLEETFAKLKDEYDYIFDKDTLTVNPEILASYDNLDEATQEQIDNLQEWADAAQEAEAQIQDTLEGLTGTLGSDLRDSLVSAFEDGTDAAADFADATEAVLENMLEQFIFAAYFQDMFDNLQSDMESSVKGDSTTSIPDLIGQFFSSNEWQNANEGFQNDLAETQAKFQDLYDLSLWSGDEDDSLTSGIQGMTEDTANIIAAYLNTIRHQVILNTGYLEQLLSEMQSAQINASLQLTELIGINNNTKRMADILEDAQNGSKALKVA